MSVTMESSGAASALAENAGVAPAENTGSSSTPRRMTFAEMILAAGMAALSYQEGLFEKEYAKAEERVNEMALVNEAVQMVNGYKASFDKDGKASGPNKISDTELYLGPIDRQKWQDEYYPQLVASGKIKDGQGGSSGIGTDSKFSQREMDAFLENARAYQSTLSSKNEQQMLLTNNAASRRTSVFQQMQTLLSTAKEALQAASR